MQFLIQLTILLAILIGNSLTTDSEDDDITVTDIAPCLEGRNHTLICKLKKRRSVVKWMDGNNVIPIVYCQIKGQCTLNPKYKGQYDYSYDPIRNEVNLVILKVDKTYNGKMLVCSDGTDFGCKVLTIQEYEQSLEETEKGKMTATSACSSGRNVTFKWIKIDAYSNQELDFKPKILYKNVTDCSNECGIRKKYTETIHVAPGGNETKYYLKVAVVYDTEGVVSEKNDMIEKEEEESEVFDDDRANNALVPVVVVVVIIIVAVIIAAGVMIFWRKRITKNFGNLCRGAKNSEGDRRKRTYRRRAENAEEEIESLKSSTMDFTHQDSVGVLIRVFNELEENLAKRNAAKENQNDTETVSHQDMEPDANMAEDGKLMNQSDAGVVSNSTGTMDCTHQDRDGVLVRLINAFKNKLARRNASTENQNGTGPNTSQDGKKTIAEMEGQIEDQNGKGETLTNDVAKDMLITEIENIRPEKERPIENQNESEETLTNDVAKDMLIAEVENTRPEKEGPIENQNEIEDSGTNIIQDKKEELRDTKDMQNAELRK